MADGHLTSLEVDNYRGFSSLSVPNLALVNVLGGTNGIGKSALLEALFHLADRLSPITLFRPYQWRRIPLAPHENLDAVKQIYFGKNTSKPIKISGKTISGKRVSVEYSFGKHEIPNAVAQNVQQGELTRSTTETSFTSTGEGYRVIAKTGSKIDLDAIVQVSSNGVFINIVSSNPIELATSTIVTPNIRGSDEGIPGRYSNLVRREELPILIELIHLVHPNIRDLKLLTAGSTATLHADIGSNNWVQLPFLGEGAVSLTSAILAIADSRGGMVLLDEIDSAVHHATLQAMWCLLFRAAKRFDTQLFVTTHSEESLEALTSAMISEGIEQNTSYHRLRRDKHTKIVPVSYNGNELSGALAQDWEVR